MIIHRFQFGPQCTERLVVWRYSLHEACGNQRSLITFSKVFKHASNGIILACARRVQWLPAAIIAGVEHLRCNESKRQLNWYDLPISSWKNDYLSNFYFNEHDSCFVGKYISYFDNFTEKDISNLMCLCSNQIVLQENKKITLSSSLQYQTSKTCSWPSPALNASSIS